MQDMSYLTERSDHEESKPVERGRTDREKERFAEEMQKILTREEQAKAR